MRCGTPDITVAGSDFSPGTKTVCSLYSKAKLQSIVRKMGMQLKESDSRVLLAPHPSRPKDVRAKISNIVFFLRLLPL